MTHGLTVDHQRSLQGLQEEINKIKSKHPTLLAVGEDALSGLSTAKIPLLAEPERFHQVVERILKARERRDAKLSSRFGSFLAKLAPLASITLGMTGSAAEVRRLDVCKV